MRISALAHALEKGSPEYSEKRVFRGAFFLWEILLKVSAEKKDPSGRIALRGKNVPLARDVTERFTTGKMECKKEKTHVLHKLNISEILHFTRRCYDDTCKNEM